MQIREKRHVSSMCSRKYDVELHFMPSHRWNIYSPARANLIIKVSKFTSTTSASYYKSLPTTFPSFCSYCFLLLSRSNFMLIYTHNAPVNKNKEQMCSKIIIQIKVKVQIRKEIIKRFTASVEFFWRVKYILFYLKYTLKNDIVHIVQYKNRYCTFRLYFVCSSMFKYKYA